jgi:hypothetical protein
VSNIARPFVAQTPNALMKFHDPGIAPGAVPRQDARRRARRTE